MAIRFTSNQKMTLALACLGWMFYSFYRAKQHEKKYSNHPDPPLTWWYLSMVLSFVGFCIALGVLPEKK